MRGWSGVEWIGVDKGSRTSTGFWASRVRSCLSVCLSVCLSEDDIYYVGSVGRSTDGDDR